MKTLYIILALVLSLNVVYAQSDTARSPMHENGTTHYIADAYLSAADSLHVFPSVQLIDAYGALLYDSLHVLVGYQDSIRYTLYIIRKTPLGWLDTVKVYTVASAGGADAAWQQATAAGATHAMWTQLLAAGILPTTDLRFAVKVYAVGSEVASSLKKFNLKVLAFKKQYK
jgi:hypothetical protein